MAYLYQKSLLFFISNALEADARTPILGLEKIYDAGFRDWDGSSDSAEALVNWRAACDKHGLGKRRTIHDEEKIVVRRDDAAGGNEKTAKASHGGFDNNIEVVGRTLARITGSDNLAMPVLDLAGF